jgi:hypothetical protein
LLTLFTIRHEAGAIIWSMTPVCVFAGCRLDQDSFNSFTDGRALYSKLSFLKPRPRIGPHRILGGLNRAHFAFGRWSALLAVPNGVRAGSDNIGADCRHGRITRYSSPIHHGKRRLGMFEKQESEDSLQEELQC